MIVKNAGPKPNFKLLPVIGTYAGYQKKLYKYLIFEMKLNVKLFMKSLNVLVINLFSTYFFNLTQLFTTSQGSCH